MSYWTKITGAIKTIDVEFNSYHANEIQNQLATFSSESCRDYNLLNEMYIFEMGLRDCEDEKFEKIINCITEFFDRNKNFDFDMFVFMIENRNNICSITSNLGKLSIVNNKIKAYNIEIDQTQTNL